MLNCLWLGHNGHVGVPFPEIKLVMLSEMIYSTVYTSFFCCCCSWLFLVLGNINLGYEGITAVFITFSWSLFQLNFYIFADILSSPWLFTSIKLNY